MSKKNETTESKAYVDAMKKYEKAMKVYDQLEAMEMDAVAKIKEYGVLERYIKMVDDLIFKNTNPRSNTVRMQLTDENGKMHFADFDSIMFYTLIDHAQGNIDTLTDHMEYVIANYKNAPIPVKPDKKDYQ